MLWSSVDILHGIFIAVGIMLIVVLYHVIFIVVDLRKTVRRVQLVSEEVQTVIMKPLSVADQAMQWVKGFLDEKAKHQKKHQDS